jgi:hypothetical protein
MSTPRVPFIESEAEPLAVNGDYTLDWFTAVLTEGATAFMWPNDLFSKGGFVPIGEPVIALRLWHRGERLITVWRPHSQAEYEPIAKAGPKILDTLIHNWQSMADAGPHIR